MIKTYKRLNGRGDTIVEVLVALAVIGIILVSGYLLASASLRAERSSQEHSEALQVGESQIESIKSYLAANPTASLNTLDNTNGSFCIHNSPTPNTLFVDTSNCKFDQSNNWIDPSKVPNPVQPYFTVSIQRDNSYWKPQEQVDMTITWQGLNGPAMLQMSYRFN